MKNLIRFSLYLCGLMTALLALGWAQQPDPSCKPMPVEGYQCTAPGGCVAYCGKDRIVFRKGDTMESCTPSGDGWVKIASGRRGAKPPPPYDLKTKRKWWNPWTW